MTPQMELLLPTFTPSPWRVTPRFRTLLRKCVMKRDSVGISVLCDISTEKAQEAIDLWWNPEILQSFQNFRDKPDFQRFYQGNLSLEKLQGQILGALIWQKTHPAK